MERKRIIFLAVVFVVIVGFSIFGTWSLRTKTVDAQCATFKLHSCEQGFPAVACGCGAPPSGASVCTAVSEVRTSIHCGTYDECAVNTALCLCN